jgi:hypothetical protein
MLRGRGSIHTYEYSSCLLPEADLRMRRISVLHNQDKASREWHATLRAIQPTGFQMPKFGQLESWGSLEIPTTSTTTSTRRRAREYMRTYDSYCEVASGPVEKWRSCRPEWWLGLVADSCVTSRGPTFLNICAHADARRLEQNRSFTNQALGPVPTAINYEHLRLRPASSVKTGDHHPPLERDGPL